MSYVERMKNLPLEAIEAPARDAVVDAIQGTHALGLATCHSDGGGAYYLYPDGSKRYQTEADRQRTARYLRAARSLSDYFGLEEAVSLTRQKGTTVRIPDKAGVAKLHPDELSAMLDWWTDSPKELRPTRQILQRVLAVLEDRLDPTELAGPQPLPTGTRLLIDRVRGMLLSSAG
ncbi:hypothetical protein [Rhodanobacter koreensis]